MPTFAVRIFAAQLSIDPHSIGRNSLIYHRARKKGGVACLEVGMRRRDFITGIAGSLVTCPLVARAQQAQRRQRIGVLMGYAETDPAAQAQVAAVRGYRARALMP